MGRKTDTLLKGLRSVKPISSLESLTLLKFVVSRVKVMRNKRTVASKKLRREIADLIKSGQDAQVYITKADILIKEENLIRAYDLIEQFCQAIIVRFPVIDAQRNLPNDMKEPITSLIYAAPRCIELEELRNIKDIFTRKYGRDFAAAVTELRPDCGVNREIIEKLSTSRATGEAKLKLMKEICVEYNIEWSPGEAITGFSNDTLDQPQQSRISNRNEVQNAEATGIEGRVMIQQSVISAASGKKNTAEEVANAHKSSGPSSSFGGGAIRRPLEKEAPSPNVDLVREEVANAHKSSGPSSTFGGGAILRPLESPSPNVVIHIPPYGITKTNTEPLTAMSSPPMQPNTSEFENLQLGVDDSEEEEDEEEQIEEYVNYDKNEIMEIQREDSERVKRAEGNFQESGTVTGIKAEFPQESKNDMQSSVKRQSTKNQLAVEEPLTRNNSVIVDKPSKLGMENSGKFSNLQSTTDNDTDMRGMSLTEETNSLSPTTAFIVPENEGINNRAPNISQAAFIETDPEILSACAQQPNVGLVSTISSSQLIEMNFKENVQDSSPSAHIWFENEGMNNVSTRIGQIAPIEADSEATSVDAEQPSAVQMVSSSSSQTIEKNLKEKEESLSPMVVEDNINPFAQSTMEDTGKREDNENGSDYIWECDTQHSSNTGEREDDENVAAVTESSAEFKEDQADEYLNLFFSRHSQSMPTYDDDRFSISKLKSRLDDETTEHSDTKYTVGNVRNSYDSLYKGSSVSSDSLYKGSSGSSDPLYKGSSGSSDPLYKGSSGSGRGFALDEEMETHGVIPVYDEYVAPPSNNNTLIGEDPKSETHGVIPVYDEYVAPPSNDNTLFGEDPNGQESHNKTESLLKSTVLDERWESESQAVIPVYDEYPAPPSNNNTLFGEDPNHRIFDGRESHMNKIESLLKSTVLEESSEPLQKGGIFESYSMQFSKSTRETDENSEEALTEPIFDSHSSAGSFKSTPSVFDRSSERQKERIWNEEAELQDASVVSYDGDPGLSSRGGNRSMLYSGSQRNMNNQLYGDGTGSRRATFSFRDEERPRPRFPDLSVETQYSYERYDNRQQLKVANSNDARSELYDRKLSERLPEDEVETLRGKTTADYGKLKTAASIHKEEAMYGEPNEGVIPGIDGFLRWGDEGSSVMASASPMSRRTKRSSITSPLSHQILRQESDTTNRRYERKEHEFVAGSRGGGMMASRGDARRANYNEGNLQAGGKAADEPEHGIHRDPLMSSEDEDELKRSQTWRRGRPKRQPWPGSKLQDEVDRPKLHHSEETRLPRVSITDAAQYGKVDEYVSKVSRRQREGKDVTSYGIFGEVEEEEDMVSAIAPQLMQQKKNQQEEHKSSRNVDAIAPQLMQQKKKQQEEHKSSRTTIAEDEIRPRWKSSVSAMDEEDDRSVASMASTALPHRHVKDSPAAKLPHTSSPAAHYKLSSGQDSEPRMPPRKLSTKDEQKEAAEESYLHRPLHKEEGMFREGQGGGMVRGRPRQQRYREEMTESEEREEGEEEDPTVLATIPPPNRSNASHRSPSSATASISAAARKQKLETAEGSITSTATEMVGGHGEKQQGKPTVVVVVERQGKGEKKEWQEGEVKAPVVGKSAAAGGRMNGVIAATPASTSAPPPPPASTQPPVTLPSKAPNLDDLLANYEALRRNKMLAQKKQQQQ